MSGATKPSRGLRRLSAENRQMLLVMAAAVSIVLPILLGVAFFMSLGVTS